MTDEEMAEKYYYKTYPVTLNIGEEERKKEVISIFLAGLKAGRAKLHKKQCKRNPSTWSFKKFLEGEKPKENKPPYAFCALDTKCELWKDGFQKGAEFAYNKAKEEMQAQIEKMKCCEKEGK